MSITFACGQCGKPFTVDDKLAGKKGKCKQCGALMMIPTASLVMPVARSVEQEISPSRRAPTAPRPPRDDVFGFEDDPGPARAATGVMEDEDFSPVLAPRPKQRSARTFDPPAKKKKRRRSDGQEPAAMVFFRILLGLFIGSVGMFGSLIMMGQLPKLTGLGFHLPGVRPTDAIFKERVELNQELIRSLQVVRDAPTAAAASASVNRQIRAISANLRKLKDVKTSKAEAEASMTFYKDSMTAATSQLIQQFLRIVPIPGAFDALDVKEALQELERDENAVGLKQQGVPLPPRPPVAPIAPFPQRNANQQPGIQPPKMPNAPGGLRNQNRGGVRRNPGKNGGIGP